MAMWLSVSVHTCPVSGIREGHLEFFPDGHNMSPEGKACLRLFLPPQAGLNAETFETLTLDDIGNAQCSRLIYVTSAGLGKAQKVLESAKLSFWNLWTSLDILEFQSVSNLRRTPGDNLSVDMYLTDWEDSE